MEYRCCGKPFYTVEGAEKYAKAFLARTNVPLVKIFRREIHMGIGFLIEEKSVNP